MTADPLAEFVTRIEQAIAEGAFARLVLSKPRPGAPPGIARRVAVRPLRLKDREHLSFVDSHPTRDVTLNLPVDAGVQRVRELLGTAFGDAHLATSTAQLQLLVSRKGKATLRRVEATSPSPAAASPRAHDRDKQRFLDLDRGFLVELGVTTTQHQLVPAMARKWKQINKFIEVLDHALDATALKAGAALDVHDFGSGKGYLTFAMHDYLRGTLGLPAQVTGVELRADMVALGNAAVQRLGLVGLHFEQGDVRSASPAHIDIMVALHACDTATDHAIHCGVRAGASIILCAPCCHKELRPQLLQPHPLRPILKHGVHLGQQAEMLTDSLRALLLDACGYDTQVFEFVALEHTQKNKMILAVKRAVPRPADAAWEQVRELKGYYGVRDQCLERLLRADAAAPEAAAAT
jgi:SAM-dependent methyltransferase